MPPLTASFSATYPTSSLDFWPQPPPTTAPGGPGAGESKPSSQEQAAPPEQAAGGGSSPGVPKGCSTWPRHQQHAQSCSPLSHFRRGHGDKKKKHRVQALSPSPSPELPRQQPHARQLNPGSLLTARSDFSSAPVLLSTSPGLCGGHVPL